MTSRRERRLREPSKSGSARRAGHRAHHLPFSRTNEPFRRRIHQKWSPPPCATRRTSRTIASMFCCGCGNLKAIDLLDPFTSHRELLLAFTRKMSVGFAGPSIKASPYSTVGLIDSKVSTLRDRYSEARNIGRNHDLTLPWCLRSSPASMSERWRGPWIARLERSHARQNAGMSCASCLTRILAMTSPSIALNFGRNMSRDGRNNAQCGRRRPALGLSVRLVLGDTGRALASRRIHAARQPGPAASLHRDAVEM